MVEDGLSVLKFYYCNVNILIKHTICILHAFLNNTTYSLCFMWYTPVNEEWLWIMAVEWFYLLLRPLLVALVDHVVFTCFQV